MSKYRQTWLNQPSNRWRFNDAPADAADAGDAGDGAADTGGAAPAAAPVRYFDSTPEDWREQIAGDDTAQLNQLKRMPDFNAFTKNYFESQNKIRTGQIEPLQAPGEDATPEQVTEYRTLMGVPETVDGYEVQLADGLVVGERDKPIMTAVYEAAHAANVPTAAVTHLANAMFHAREVEAQSAAAQQEQHKVDAVSVLKDTWKGDYNGNIGVITNVIINSLPEAVREQFTNAVMPDGRALFNSPEVLVAMADWARKIDPAATLVPNSPNAVKTMDNEIKALEDRMGTSEWFKDQAAQDRYQELVAAKQRMG